MSDTVEQAADDPRQQSLRTLKNQRAKWEELHATQTMLASTGHPNADAVLHGTSYTAYMVLGAAIDIVQGNPVHVGTFEWMQQTVATTRPQLAALNASRS